ncbi:MAG: DUF3208 family protein [Trueperaceae bacterium]|nr:DUF3208 family protein [Trueperaceae bacterium]
MNDDAQRPIKLLQGYLWFPGELDVDLARYLPERLEPDVHVLWDELPRPPFSFFDDGTMAATQRVYQLTVLTFADDEESAGRLVPWLAETLQAALEDTPEGVGWQIMEDLRPIE